MKTRKRMQRFLSVLVTLTMILGMFPATALAVEEKPSDLPTATVTKIKNNDLTFALNFKADPATEDQLAKYGSWYADFVLTVNKEVTFNANGDADGYLSGQYDEWSDNWVNVPFEDVTLKAGESLKIMAYAAEMLGEPGLKYTYGEVYEFVKDFDCGVYFEPEFLNENPDLEVTLELRMYNPAEGSTESYAIGDTYVYTADMVTPDLPTATVTELDNDELTFALNFLADEATDEQLDYYGDWYADFELKLNKTFTANADGDADGYLAGQYENWSEEWLKVPYGIDGGVTVEANTPVKVMESAAALMGQGGLKLTYNDVYTFVKEFKCGLFIEDAYLAANPDLVATLELRMYNPDDATESYVIGKTYTFEVPTGESDKDPVVEIPANIVDSVIAGSDAASETEKQALKTAVESIVDEIVENTAVNGYEVQLPEEVETITITLSDMDVKTGTGEVVPTKITYTVVPENVGGDKVSKPSEPITFRLPVPANVTAKSAKVYHDGVEMEKLFTIQGSGNAKYVEISAKDFSDFAVEFVNEAAAGLTINTVEEMQAFAAAVNGGNTYDGETVTLAADLNLSGIEWTPIGTGARSSKTYTGNSFKGTFDGGNHTISGLTITETANKDAALGLFGVVDGGTIKNLKLTDVNVNVPTSNLIGAAIGMMVNNATADSITVSGAVIGYDGVGGIVGRLIISGTIKDCTNNASVTSPYGGIGGIVGKPYYEDGTNTALFANISGCTNNGTITAPMYVGGIAGLARANVTNCVNNGAVVGGTQTGGIVGQLIAAGIVSGNENTAKITGKNHMGGIIGDYTQSSAYTYYNVAITNNINRGELVAIEQCAAIMGCNNIDGFTAMTASGNVSYYYVDGLELFGNPEDMVIDDTNKFVVEPTGVAKIDETYYATLAEALTAAQNMTGDVVVEIYDKVTLNTALYGSYDSIKFVGMDTDAEIYLDIDGYITATGKKVAFEGLTLSKSAGPYMSNAGFMNVAFGIYDVAEVTYTNCTFANGAYAAFGKVTFDGCTFYRSHDRYGLWAYGNVDVVVDGCTFDDIRGIKMYAEGMLKTVDLTVKNTVFTNKVDNKPAIVLTCGESVKLENNTYSSTGVFELDLDGAPNGTPVTSDVPPTCVNDDGACGVLVDGKIYTTVAQAAEVTTSGSTVTLLHESTETVELPEGVTLDKNGFEAAGVTVKVAADVAKIGETGYATLAEALAAAKAGDEIVLLANVAEDVTVPAGVIFNGNGKQVGVITAAGKITFKGHTKATNFGTQYTNTTINIIEGACLEITGTDRLVVGHGCTFNITGTIADAKNAEGTIQPSLIMPGASFTGAGVAFNVTNAYIKAPSSYCSSSKSASGTFDFNIENSIIETAGKLAFEVQSTAATVNFELKDSVLTTGSHLVFGVSRGEVVIDNSNVNVGTSRQLENRSTMTIKNGSVVNGLVHTSSNCINPGTTIVENATYAVTGQFSGAAEGTGTLIIKKGATVSVGSIVDKAEIVIDAAGMTADDVVNFTANLSKFTGELSVINNDKLEAKIVDGKIVLVEKPVAKIGETPYATIAAAIAAAQDGDTVVIMPGEYGAINISNKNITIKGTVGENGELLTTIKGGNPAITGHGFNGTIRDLKIVDAFKVMYAEPAGNVTVDNVYVTGATYGFHLVAYSTGLTWKIQNSYMDLSWANSFGVYGNGDAEIIIKENTLVSTEPYYPEYGALLVNSFLPNVTVEENVFGENAKIMIRPDVTDTSKVNISKNYHADGVENAFVDDGVKVDITKYYAELNDNGTINKDSLVEVSANVAEVNGVGYATLAEAVEAAQTGETIKLIDNVVLSEMVVIPVGKTMTLDLNGKTVSMEESILTTAYAINNLGNLTLMDSVGGGSINARGIYNGYVDGGENVATAKLTVESGTYNAMGTNGGATIFNYGIVDINGGKFTSAGGYGLNNQAGASMAISNAEVNGGIYNMGSLTVENTKVYQHLSGKHAIYNWSATLVIESGEFDSVSGNELILADGQNSSVVINGGTFNKTAKSWLFGAATGKNISFTINDGIFNGYVNLPEGSVDTIRPYNDPIVVKGGMFNFDPTKWVAEGFEVKDNGDGTYDVVEAKNYVAQVGDAQFESLQAAIDAAANGNTITLLADVALTNGVTVAGKAITLELNGKTMSMVYAENATKNHEMIHNYGNLTIQDTVGGGKLSYKYTGANLGTTYAANTIATEPGSVLTVKSGTIENLTYDQAIIAYAIDGRTNGGAGNVTVNIEGGTITSLRQAVRIFANSTTNTGTLNISGGDITGRVIVQNSNTNANKAALAITGGTFTPNEYKTDVLYVGGNNSATIDMTATVSGGTFNGKITETNVTGFITGGTFKVKPAESCAIDGYEFTENADGTYGVEEKPEVAFQQAYNKTTYQIGLIEPWALRINARVTDSQFNTIDYSKVIDYGVYAIRRGQLSNPDMDISGMTIEDLMDEANVIHFNKEDGTAVQNDRYVTFTYSEGLYTYRLKQDIVWALYYETADGVYATAVQQRNLFDLMNERKDSTSSTYSAEEKQVYADMVNLYNKITDYRSDFDNLSDMELQNTATMESANIAFGALAEDGKYGFARVQQIGLIEPWGMRLNTRIYSASDKNGVVDYNQLTDYGVIVFHDKDGAVAAEDMNEYTEMLNYADKKNVYVFSDSQGTTEISGKYAASIYNKDIFTYEMDSTLYYMFFAQDGENFYYSQVYATNIRTLAADRSVSTSTTYSEKEKSTYAAMVGLCDSIAAYHDYYYNR